MKYFIALFSSIIGLFIIGCSYYLTMSIVDDNPIAPVFSIERKGAFLQKSYSGVYIVIVDIEKDVGCDNKNHVWAIEIPPGMERKLESVTYGVVPEGYRELVKAQPLLPNIVYHMSICATGGVGGIKFNIVEDASGRKVIPVKDK